MVRGFFGIGIIGCKITENIGTLWRSAHNFRAAFCFIIGPRYRRVPSDTTHIALHVPFYEYQTFEEFQRWRPRDSFLIGVEQTNDSIPVETFCHPERAIYILGAEDSGLPSKVIEHCQDIVHISTPMCINVAVAGSIVIYDRCAKQKRVV